MFFFNSTLVFLSLKLVGNYIFLGIRPYDTPHSHWKFDEIYLVVIGGSSDSVFVSCWGRIPRYVSPRPGEEGKHPHMLLVLGRRSLLFNLLFTNQGTVARNFRSCLLSRILEFFDW